MKTTTKPKLNVRLLRRIQKHILEEPRRFFMTWFVEYGTPGSTCKRWPDSPDKFPACGTTACIAGWANILTRAEKGEESNILRACEKLGINRDDSSQAGLFNRLSWPEPFKSHYAKAKTPKTRSKIAAARIEHLIKTGE